MEAYEVNKVAKVNIDRAGEGEVFSFSFAFLDYALLPPEAQEMLRELAHYDPQRRAWLTDQKHDALKIQNLLQRNGFTLVFLSSEKIPKQNEIVEEKKRKLLKRLQALEQKPWLAFLKVVRVKGKKFSRQGKRVVIFRADLTPSSVLALAQSRVFYSQGGKAYTCYLPTNKAVRKLMEDHGELVKRRADRAIRRIKEQLKRIEELYGG